MTTQYDPSRIAIAIPARMESKRLPGKPLVEVGGKPLLQWAWEAASACKEAYAKFVVTDSWEVEQYCQQRHIPFFISKQKHHTGLDRIAEVIVSKLLGTSPCQKLTHVIDLQCDEPDITGKDLDRMARSLRDNRTVITFSSSLSSVHIHDRNAVKVLVDSAGFGVYFSREPLGTSRLHAGVYGVPVKKLCDFYTTPRPLMELTERLEQLRFLHMRVPIEVLCFSKPIRSINTPQDVEQWSAATT